MKILSYFQNITIGLAMKTAVGLAMIGSLPLERSYFCLIAITLFIAKKALHCQPSGNEGVFIAKKWR